MLFLYVWFVRPGPPATCSNSMFDQGEENIDCGAVCARPCVFVESPLVVRDVWTFEEEGGTTSVLARVANPNLAAAAERFTYSFRLFDEGGGELPPVHGSSFMYAGEVKYILLSRLSLGKLLGHAGLVLGEAQWVESAAFTQPQVGLEYAVTTSTMGGAVVRGTVTNNDLTALRRVKLIAIFYTPDGELMGAEEEEVAYLAPRERAAFAVGREGSIDLLRTEVVVSAQRQ